MRENLKKIIIIIKNVIGSEDTLMNKAERPNNYFSNTVTDDQIEQIKKGVICVHFVLENTDLNTVESISRLNNFITYLSWLQ